MGGYRCGSANAWITCSTVWRTCRTVCTGMKGTGDWLLLKTWPSIAWHNNLSSINLWINITFSLSTHHLTGLDTPATFVHEPFSCPFVYYWRGCSLILVHSLVESGGWYWTEWPDGWNPMDYDCVSFNCFSVGPPNGVMGPLQSLG